MIVEFYILAFLIKIILYIRGKKKYINNELKKFNWNDNAIQKKKHIT